MSKVVENQMQMKDGGWYSSCKLKKVKYLCTLLFMNVLVSNYRWHYACARIALFQLASFTLDNGI